MRKEMSSGPALASGATPLTTRRGSPSSVAPSAAASSPRVNPAGAAILLLLDLGPGVVRADDLVGEIGFHCRVQHHRAALLDDEVVAALLADLLDHAGDVLEDLLQQALLLLLELLLEVVGEPGGVTPLAVERLLLFAARLHGHQRPLLLQLVAELLELYALAVHLLLHRG